MDSRDSLDQTLDSIDQTESQVKHTNTQRHIEKINEDTSDDDTDEIIDFEKDKASKIYRKDINEQRKRAKIVKSKKGRTTKIYAINIERKLAKGLALQANGRANRASNDTQSITNTNDEMIGDFNTDAIIGVDNTDNAAIAAENVNNAATDAENTDNAAINADNTSNAATDSEKSDDAAMSDNNTDNTTTGDGNTDNTTTVMVIQIMLQQVMVILIIPQQARLVLYTYPCLHVMVDKPNIQAKLKPPQNIYLPLQNLQ